MTSEQKYEGKGNYATSSSENGSTIEQTGESSPQAANSAVSAENQTGADSPLPDPQFTTEGAKTAKVDPITIDLPFFLRWQVQDEPQAIKVFGAIEKVFHAWERSKEGRELAENNFTQYMAYSALRYNFEEIIEKAAAQRLGIFVKPKLTEYLFEPAPLATHDSGPDPMLVDDPGDSTDVGKLCQWIKNLQQVARLQQQANADYEQAEAKNALQAQKQQETIANLEQQVKTLEQAPKRAVRAEQSEHVPRANHFVDLFLYVTGGYESEVELVREVLAAASEERRQKVFRHIALDETEDAFFVNEEHTKLQNVLGRLTQVVTQLAVDNFSRSSYSERPDFYLNLEKTQRRKFMDRKEAFLEEYSVSTESDDEETPDQSTAEVKSEALSASTDTTQEANGQSEDTY